MKTIREILTDVFNNITIIMIVALFIFSFLFFWGTCDTFLVALKDSAILTAAMIFFVIFGRYIKSLDEKNL